MSRVFPRRFVLPLNLDSDKPCGENLNTRSNSTATAIKTDKNKVGLRVNVFFFFF